MPDTSERLQVQLATLRAVSRALARPLDEIGVFRAVHTALSGALDATICFFGRYDAAGKSVRVVWQIHAGAELPGGRFPIGSGPTSRAILTCQPQLIRELSREGPPVQVQYATDRPALPESLLAVPVVFDGVVMGVLCIQSYQANAYDREDVVLVQSLADQLAVALAGHQPPAGASDGEGIFASLPDALVVLDKESRVVRVNQAAREMLCTDGCGLIFGQPVDQPQADQWPLGTRKLTEQLRPVVDQLRHGTVPQGEIELSLDRGRDRTVRCKASLLLDDDADAGAVMMLRAAH